MTGIQINKAIYSILSGSTHYLVSGKTYPIFAPDETLNPFIVYERKSINPSYTKDGLLFDDCVVTINIVSDNYTECVNIAEAVRTALEFKRGSYGGLNIFESKLISADEDYGVDGFITQLQFAIKCK